VDSSRQVVIDNIPYRIQRAHTLALIRWLVEHENDVPDVGSVEFNLNAARGSLKAKIHRECAAVEFAPDAKPIA